jgi:uncharacterized integral membrane protein
VSRTGWLFVAAAGVLGGIFAVLNRWERVSVDLGITRLNAVPLALFFFAAFLLGMVAMFFISLPQDRRARDVMRAHGLLGAPAPPPPAAARPSAQYEPAAARPDPRDALDS